MVSEAGFEVSLPSGAITRVLTMAEVAYVNDKCARYFEHNHIENVSDIQDIDRLIRLELLCSRYSDFLNRGGIDYFDKPVDETELRRSLTNFCVDEETEILTWFGWRRYDALAVGDLVLTLNVATGLAEWQPVKAVSGRSVPSDGASHA